MPCLQNTKHILYDFHKNIFWVIIQFPEIIHSYSRYVDQKYNVEEVEYWLKNLILGKIKIPETNYFI